MRVFIGPVEVAGQANTWARALRELGVEAYNYVSKEHAFGYPADRRFRHYGPTDKLVSLVGRVFEFRQLREQFDVFHYLFGKSVLRWPLRSLEFGSLCRDRKLVMSFFGDDVRLPSVAARRCPEWVNAYHTKDSTQQRRLRYLSRFFATALAGGPEGGELSRYAAPYFQRVLGLPIALDLSDYPWSPSINARPVVLHCPSRSTAKGTEHVERAVEKLRDELDFDFRLLTGLSHAEVLQATRKADIVIDQLVIGEHGAYAVEAMALGKPVLCYLHPDFVPCYPEGLPLVNASTTTVGDRLRELICSPERRKALASAGRAYVERVHDARVVARRLVEIYQSL